MGTPGSYRSLKLYLVTLDPPRSYLEPRSSTLDRPAGHCPGDLSAIAKRLKELADQKGAYKLKYGQMISKDQIHDAAIVIQRCSCDVLFIR
jgi:hypothetical protein